MRKPSSFITTREAAERLGVTPQTIRNHLPRLGGTKILGRWFVDAGAVDAELLMTQGAGHVE